MSDYLYKAFAPSKSGKKQIYLNGQIISGKWVWGSYIPANECCDKHIITGVEYLNEYGDIGEVSHEVIPETVCVAIPGLKDKNGWQVFNHDLVTLNKLLGVYEVRWHEAQCRYDLYLDGHPVSGCNPDTIKNYEVIETIFDKENN